MKHFSLLRIIQAFCKIPKYQAWLPFTFPRTRSVTTILAFPGKLHFQGDGVGRGCSPATATLSLLPYGLMQQNYDLLGFFLYHKI